MTQFRGLHNPERHTPYAVNGGPAVVWCRDNCEHGNGTQCAMGDPCRCCLAAEVETLRRERDRYKRLWEQEHCPTCFGPCGGCDDALDGDSDE